MSTSGPVEHFFRHEYGKLVATLTRRFGVQNLEAIEDAAQSALLTALERWKMSGLPDNPTAWLFRVAQNEVTSELRARSMRLRRLAEDASAGPPAIDDDPEAFFASEVQDALLQMLFVCCDDEIPQGSQLVLALKTLCGFDVREIAFRLFMTEANVYKRLGRARARLRERPPHLDGLDAEQYRSRVPAVHRILYVLFTEGYLSVREEAAIRAELCLEAIRLATLLAEHPVGATPESHALLALMHLHEARAGARQDASGGLLLLAEQDRGLWDPVAIQTGLTWLARSASGDVYSRYHAEAAIAAEHCLAPSFEATRWDKVAAAYAHLERVAPSAIHRLNRAVAVAEERGPAAGLAVLEGFEPPSWLVGSYMWSAVLADLHRRAGHAEAAARHRALALDAAPTPAIRTLLARRLEDRPSGGRRGRHD